MAEEQKEEAQEAKQGSPLIGLIIKGGIMVLLPMVLGLVVFLFVLYPRFNTESVDDPILVEDDIIPLSEVIVDLEEQRVHLIIDDPDAGGAIMLYTVSIVVDREESAAIVSGPQTARFSGMIAELHKNRTQDEMNDALVQKSIEKQILQGTNDLLHRLAPEADPPHRAVQVFHKFQIVPL